MGRLWRVCAGALATLNLWMGYAAGALVDALSRLARLAERPPVQLRVLLATAGRARDVGLDGDLGVGKDVPGGVDHHGADALGPDVEGEDAIRRHPCRSDSRMPGFIGGWL